MIKRDLIIQFVVSFACSLLAIGLLFGFSMAQAQGGDPAPVTPVVATASAGDTWVAIVVIAGVFLSILGTVVTYLTSKDTHNQSKTLVAALSTKVEGFGNDDRLIGLIRDLATKVVPVELLSKVDAGANAIKAWTPDDVDRLIDSITKTLHKAADPEVVAETVPKVDAS